MEPTDRDFKRRSKFLSKILRHKPEMVGVELDLQGWVDVDLLLDAMQALAGMFGVDDFVFRTGGWASSLRSLEFTFENVNLDAFAE